jgi:ribulose 1,5-bisphosphate synthetase/thiazole synthase
VDNQEDIFAAIWSEPKFRKGGVTEAINRNSYRQVALDDKWDAVVIGSGIGGLSAAVLLSVYGGKRVLVLARSRTTPPACGLLSIT